MRVLELVLQHRLGDLRDAERLAGPGGAEDRDRERLGGAPVAGVLRDQGADAAIGLDLPAIDSQELAEAAEGDALERPLDALQHDAARHLVEAVLVAVLEDRPPLQPAG